MLEQLTVGDKSAPHNPSTIFDSFLAFVVAYARMLTIHSSPVRPHSPCQNNLLLPDIRMIIDSKILKILLNDVSGRSRYPITPKHVNLTCIICIAASGPEGIDDSYGTTALSLLRSLQEMCDHLHQQSNLQACSNLFSLKALHETVVASQGVHQTSEQQIIDTLTRWPV